MIFSTDKNQVSLRYVARPFRVQKTLYYTTIKHNNSSGSSLSDILTRSPAAISADR